jgi:hypothetical protein
MEKGGFLYFFFLVMESNDSKYFTMNQPIGICDSMK